MNQNSLNLLLVDDEETFVKVLAMHLRDNYGYSTTVVLSGREAIKAIEETRRGFDVILLDYLMPDMNGLNVLQWMLEQKNQTPVIMLTAAGSEQVAVEALKLGAYDYVRKELIDLEHIDIVIRGTHERHLYRIAETMEREKQSEMAMNNYATELVRLLVNTIAPRLNSVLAQLAGNIENDSKSLLARLAKKDHDELAKLLGDIERNVRMLETATRGFMGLFELVYAHHSEIPNIENLKHWFQKELKISQYQVQSTLPVSELAGAGEGSTGESSVTKILVIDDDEMMLNALKTLLEDEHYVVTTTSDGHKGIEIHREQRQEVVLLDLKLPSITGLEILQEIKRTNADAKVIIITGFSSPEAVEEAKSLGAFGFYEKSRDVDELLEIIRRAVTENHSMATKSSS